MVAQRVDAMTTMELEERLRHGAPSEKLQIFQQLELQRGVSYIRVLEACRFDPDPTIRQNVQTLLEHMRYDTETFGAGSSLTFPIPPRPLTSEEERKSTRWIWVAWAVGGFIAVNALIVREHTGMTFLPMIGAIVSSFCIYGLSLWLRRDAGVPGWILIGPDPEVLIEKMGVGGAVDRTVLPLSLQCRIEWRRVGDLPDEVSSEQPFEVFLTFPEHDSLMLTRRLSQQDAMMFSRRLERYLHVFTADT